MLDINLIAELWKKFTETIYELEDSLAETNNPSQQRQIILLMEECGSKLDILSEWCSHLCGSSQCCSLDGHSVNVLCDDEDYVCMQKHTQDVENCTTDTDLRPNNKDEEYPIVDQSFLEVGALEYKKTSNNGPVNICSKSQGVRLAAASQLEKTLGLDIFGHHQKYQGWIFQELKCLAEDLWKLSLLWNPGGPGAQIRTCFDPGGGLWL